MIGAIIGDVIGSRFEFRNTDSKFFEMFHRNCCFTDDTVMTCAVAKSIMDCFNAEGNFDRLSEYAVRVFHEVGVQHPGCGYGGRFYKWMLGNVWEPYNSCGNGSAMRISPVGDIATTVEEAKDLSYKLTAITHNHPEGIKGAEAVAVAKVMLKQGKSKDAVRKVIERDYYKVNWLKRYRAENKGEHGDELCQVSVPQAFACLFEGRSFEDVIRNCVSIGGDTDTVAAIAGGMAEAFYKVSPIDRNMVMKYLTPDLKKIVTDWDSFCERYRIVGGQDGKVIL